MRSKVAILFIFLFIVSTLRTTSAANNQGLSWGVERGDRVYYYIQGENMNGETPIVDWSVYFEVETIGDLNQTMTSWSDVAVYTPQCLFYWSNGTSYWSGIGWLAVLPIGNWTLVEGLFLDYNSFLTEDNVTETATTWGYTIHQLAGPDMQTVTVTYSKVDGVFNYHMTMWEYEDGSPTQLVEFTRMENPRGGGGLDNTMLLYLGIGVSVLVIAIVVLRRR